MYMYIMHAASSVRSAMTRLRGLGSLVPYVQNRHEAARSFNPPLSLADPPEHHIHFLLFFQTIRCSYRGLAKINQQYP